MRAELQKKNKADVQNIGESRPQEEEDSGRRKPRWQYPLDICGCYISERSTEDFSGDNK
jgi:hypothetical protein